MKKNNEEYKQTMKNTNQIKNLIINCFNDILAGMVSNKKLNPIVTELFT